MLREKIRSRSTQLTAAMIGLVLMYAASFSSLNVHLHYICKVVGGLLFFAVFFVVIKRNQKHEISSATSQKAAAFCCITGGFLFLSGFFLHTSPWLHRLIGITALGLLFICWFLPRSRWAELSMLPTLVMGLFQIQWKEYPLLFSGLLKMNPAILIAAAALWILVCRYVFRRIDKHNPPSVVELH